MSTIPHRGTIVAQVGLHDFLEIGQILALLEPFAARQAAGQIAQDALAQFQEQLRGLAGEQPSAQNIERLNQIDNQIHRLVLETAGNRRMYDMVETMRSLCDHLTFTLQPHFQIVIGELLDLIAALRAGDGAAAERIMYGHITNFGEALPRLITGQRGR